MTYKPKRQRLRITPGLNDGLRVAANTRAGPSTVLSGLPRTIRRHEPGLIVASTILNMEKRGEFPHRFDLSPRCVVWDLAEVESWLNDRQRASFERRAKIAPAPDLSRQVTWPLAPRTDWSAARSPSDLRIVIGRPSRRQVRRAIRRRPRIGVWHPARTTRQAVRIAPQGWVLANPISPIQRLPRPPTAAHGLFSSDKL